MSKRPPPHHQRLLSLDVVPYIDAHDRGAVREKPVEAIYSAQREAFEKYVAFEEFKELKRELKWCHFYAGIDHPYKCKELADAYMRKLADPDLIDETSVSVLCVDFDFLRVCGGFCLPTLKRFLLSFVIFQTLSI
jgi:hypothetical protein